MDSAIGEARMKASTGSKPRSPPSVDQREAPGGSVAVSRSFRWLFCGLLAACLLLRLRYGQGLAFKDDFAYVNAALDANELGWASYLTGISDIYANRVSIVLPLAAFQALFGRTELSLELLGLCFSLSAVVVSFAFARDLAGERAGWIAAALSAAVPQEIWYGTSLLPDSVIPFYTGMAMYLTLRAQRRALDAHGIGLYALAAFFVGCSFEARATSGILLVSLGLFALLQPRQRLLRAALPGLFFAVLLGCFWIALGLASGDYGIQLRQLIYDGTGTKWTGTGKAFQHLFTMLPIVRLLAELPHLASRTWAFKDCARYAVNTYLGLHYYLVWPAACFAAVRWRRLPAARLPLAAFAALYAFFEFGSTSLTSYQPIWKYERFLTILTVPSSVLVGVVAAALLPAAWRLPRLRQALAAAAVLYVCCSAAILEANTRFWGSPVPGVKATFERIKRAGGPDTIYVVDEVWRMRGHALLRFEPPKPHQLELLEGRDLAAVHDAWLIMDWSYFDGSGPPQLDRDRFDPRLFRKSLRPSSWQARFEESVLSWQRRRSLVEVLRLR